MYCTYCTDFKENPAKYASLKIGSRNSQTTAYWDNGGKCQIVCGCFNGSLGEFEKAVEKTHGNTKYGKQYKKYIKQVKMLMEEN